MFSLNNLARKELTHWGLDKMTRHFVDEIFKRIFLNDKFHTLLKFHIILFLGAQLTMSQHCHLFSKKQLTNQWQQNSMMLYVVTGSQWVNSLRHRDTIWWYRFESTLAQVMTCCLMAQSHHLNQWWPSIVRFYDIHLRAISYRVAKLSFSTTSWKIITATCPRGQSVNSSPPSAEYMHQWTRSTLVQVMACHLFSAKPLPEPMLTYSQLDPKEQTSVKFELKHTTFHSWKCNRKCCLWNGGHFVQWGMS